MSVFPTMASTGVQPPIILTRLTKNTGDTATRHHALWLTSTSEQLFLVRNKLDEKYVALFESGSQKDRHHGTSGAKEGFRSIGRFSKKNNLLGIFWPLPF